jgi:probable HAF family extracellular repeat protein
MNAFGPVRALLALLCSMMLLQVPAALAAPAAKWTIVELGALGSRGSIPLAINNRGDVAGYSAATVPGLGFEPFHAFLWQNGVLQDLGRDLGNPAGSAFSSIRALNDRGTLAGQHPEGAAVWKDGAWSVLPFDGWVEDINKSDIVVGIYWTGSAAHAFSYRDGVLHDLGTLGGDDSTAVAVNDRGIIAGTSRMADGLTLHAFTWRAGVMQDLGALNGTSSTASDINSHGVVVGDSFADGTAVAFIHDGAGPMRRLLDLDVPHHPVAINDRGAVIGVTDTNSFLYEDGVLTLLESIPEVKAAGWTRLYVTDINDRGWITGWGWKPDGPVDGVGFVLMPR